MAAIISAFAQHGVHINQMTINNQDHGIVTIGITVNAPKASAPAVNGKIERAGRY